MEKLVITILSFFLFSAAYAQEQAIKITKLSSKKETLIKESTRIRVKTMDGKKTSGQFSIEDPGTILINGRSIKISNIKELRKDPLLVSILTSSALIYGGGLTVGLATIAGIFADTRAFLLTIPGVGLILTGIKSPSFYKKYKEGGNWQLEIISLP